MDTASLWPIAQETLRTLGKHYGPEMDQVAADLHLPEWYGWLLAALTFEPEPISATRLRIRFPYTSARTYDERLANVARRGFLVLVTGTEDEYRLTESGREALERVVGAAYTKMAMLQPLPSAELERLAALLLRVVKSCLTAPEPPGKWCITHSRRIDPGEGAPVVIRIDQYLSDLSAYRDDAHLAAWQPYHIEGHTWEAFTYLWREEAATLDDLCQKLKHRGHSQDEYKQAVEDLIERGWVAERAEKYLVTALGNEIRQTAEETTDRYFYAPWSCLNQGEIEDLRALLMGLRSAL